MFIFVLTIHFILCAVLVGLVLIQQGKGADMGAAFGAGGSNSLFGAGGATSLIVKITTATAVAFMITSIVLINLSGSDSGLAAISAAPGDKPSLAGSVMEEVVAASPTDAPSKPANAENSTTTPSVDIAPAQTSPLPSVETTVAPAATIAVNSDSDPKQEKK